MVVDCLYCFPALTSRAGNPGCVCKTTNLLENAEYSVQHAWLPLRRFREAFSLGQCTRKSGENVRGTGCSVSETGIGEAFEGSHLAERT